MICKWSLVLYTFVIIFVKDSREECGKALAKGTVMCVFNHSVIDTFNFTLCTHGVIQPEVSCGTSKDDATKCIFSNPKETDKAINMARSGMKNLGILFLASKPQIDWLFGNQSRRPDTITEIANFLEANELKFFMFSGFDLSIGSNSSKIDQDNLFLFIKELSETLHARGFHLGLGLGLGDDNVKVVTRFNETEVSKLADWFFLSPFNVLRNKVSTPMQAYTPLIKNNDGESRGTMKYWLEEALKLFKPECLLVDIGPRLRVLRSKTAAVDPGIGSLSEVTMYGTFSVSMVCTKLNKTYLGCKESWDNDTSTPYAVCNNDFYTYDNARSLRLKADLVKKYNIPGVLIWTTDITKDNVCNKGDSLAIFRTVRGVWQSFEEEKNKK